MSDDVAGWEVVSEHVNRHGFWEMVFSLFVGARPPPTITYTVRLKSTGATRTITCFGAGELRERIAKGQFDYESLLPDDDAERVLAGFRAGGEAGKVALDHVELVFRHRLQKGDIDPKDLFTSLQASRSAVATMSSVNSPGAASRCCPGRRRRRSRTCSDSTVAASGGNGAIASVARRSRRPRGPNR